MPREKELFRDNLERLDKFYPNKEVLNIKEVMQFTGLSRTGVVNRYPFKNRFISKVKLASELS